MEEILATLGDLTEGTIISSETGNVKGEGLVVTVAAAGVGICCCGVDSTVYTGWYCCCGV